MNETYCVVTFNISQQAILFEKLLKNNGLGVKLMPVPRQLSSSCGTAAFVTCDEKAIILELCANDNILIDTFHEMEVNEKGAWFVKHLKK